VALGRVTPSGVRAVLIDGLGTLIALAPPAPLLVEALQRDYAIELSPAQAERAFALEMAYYREHHQEARDEAGLDELRRRCARVLAGGLPPEVADELGEDDLTGLLLGSLHFSAQPDARGALRALRGEGLTVVVVSNWDCGLPAVLQRIGLGGEIDGVVTSGGVGHRKPEPEIFGAALELAGVKHEEAVHVGDSIENDVRGALGADVGAILLRRGSARALAPDGLPAGVPMIDSLDELAGVVGRAGRLRSQQ
jgi:FMN phosphatase YigB (HAD superfamily)